MLLLPSSVKPEVVHCRLRNALIKIKPTVQADLCDESMGTSRLILNMECNVVEPGIEISKH